VATRRRATRRTLTGAISDVQRRLQYVETRSNPTRLANQVVKRANIQPRAVDSDQIALGAIANDNLEDAAISAAKLADNSVTNRAVAPGAIGTAELQNSSVGNAQLQDDSVGRDEIQDNAVGRDQIADGAVGGSEIASGAVSEAKIGNGEVTRDKIRDGAINGDKLANLAVVEAKIANGAVKSAKIGDGEVTNGKLSSTAVTFGKVAIGTSILTALSATSPLTRALNTQTIGTSVTVGVSVGNSSNSVAVGNHTHAVNTSVIDTTGPNTGLSHTHGYRIATSPTSTPSTLRVKKEVSDHVLDDPRRILGLRLKRFKYRNPQRGLHEGANREWMYGYIAEEVQEAGVEEVLGYDSDGLVDSVNYGLLSALLLELVRSHQDEIDSLRQDLERLKERG
jgi:hypothetical protein